MISYFLSVVTVLSCALQGNFCFTKSNFEKNLPNIKQQNFNTESTVSNVYYATKNGDITNDYLVDYKQTNVYSEPLSSTNPFEGDIFISNKKYLCTYFNHLNENKPSNKLGTCGYTGLSMLLSFYDTYWNDGFIEEIYEAKNRTKIKSSNLYNSSPYFYDSPGVYDYYMNVSPSMFVNEILDRGIAADSDEYKIELDKKYSGYIYSQIEQKSFLGSLLQLSIDNGFLKPHFDKDLESVINPQNYINGLGVNYDITNANLQSYINNNPNLKGKVDVVTSRMKSDDDSEKNRIRNEIIEIVKSGRPVLMGGKNREIDEYGNVVAVNGHVVVAYDYDENNDILYGNMGWDSSTSHYNLNNYFNYQIADYWALKIKDGCKKERTDHYVFTDKAAYYSPGFNSIYHFMPSNKMGAIQNAYGNGVDVCNSYISYPEIEQNIRTSYLRCGYIMNTCVNISTRRIGNGLAFSEYETIAPIKRIELDVSWWSDDERVTKDDSTYLLEIYLNNEYITLLDFWNDIELSTNRNQPNHLNLFFPTGVTKFRFYGYCENPINDRNKGRLSLFDMLIEYR